MKRRNCKMISSELRTQIIKEYLVGEESSKELAEKYKIKPNTLRTWLSRYSKCEKSVSLPVQPNQVSCMAKKEVPNLELENAELRRQVKELLASLKHSEMQNLALNTLIDIAEEQGIEIRKKSGAKQ